MNDTDNDPSTTFYIHSKSNNRHYFKWYCFPVDWLTGLSIDLRQELLICADYKGEIPFVYLRRFRKRLIESDFVPDSLLELLSRCYTDILSEQTPVTDRTSPLNPVMDAARTADACRSRLLLVLNEAIEKSEPLIVTTQYPGESTASFDQPSTDSGIDDEMAY